MKMLLLFAFVLMLAGPVVLAQEPTGPGYRLVWSDEFDADGKPNPENWTSERGFVRNHELQWYQPDNAFCDNGMLVIEGRRERKANPEYSPDKTDWRNREFAQYTSSCLTTRGLHSWQYGRFEVKARIQTRDGLWPAIWFLGVEGPWPDNGEIDLMEYYKGRIHANAAWGTQAQHRPKWDSYSTPVESFNDPEWENKFHVWRMDWDENEIKLYLDDELLNTIDVEKAKNPSTDRGPAYPFRQAHYLLVNLAIGGAAGGDPSKTPFPTRYEIDYVRVYQKTESSKTQPPAQTDRSRYSMLWGEHGEKWSPDSRLPNFSFAGYHSGEDPLPNVKVAANVRDFGAVGDGGHDDTPAFLDAVKATHAGAILIPAGRYKITQIVEIKKPNVVLRGEGPGKTVLFFPTPLETLRPNPSQTTGGKPTSGYSWGGGLLWINGAVGMDTISPIVNETQRGDRVLQLASPPVGIQTGDRVTVQMTDDADKSLLSHIYSGDPGDTGKINKPITIRFVSRVAKIDGSTVTLERPLRLDIRKQWQPTLRQFKPNVTECGVEDLAIEFPLTPYRGHFSEVGYNGIAINGAADCWVRNVRISNSDSGVYVRGYFCTVDGLVIDSQRPPSGGYTGHHGIDGGTDCVVTDFDIQTRFHHDLSVSGGNSGNVFKNGRGVDMTLDHHKRAPYENLFSNIDLGEGNVTWKCGGGESLGKNSGARETFWNLRAKQNQSWPPRNFGPDSMNLVGVQTDMPSLLEPDGKWFEAIPPDQLQPVELHAAQLNRRLESRP
ncbi:MAG: family 16 glycosylhydrolase [Phycisphaera sp.]|nr:family 16 glycosylhydrolase [Phycisphaera sp.]